MSKHSHLIVAVCLVACGLLNAQPGYTRTPAMDKSKAKIEALFKQTRPVCFGRFIIDIPVTAEVEWGPSAVIYDIDSYPGQGYKIPAQITAMEKELKDDKHLSEPSTHIGTFDGTNPESKIVVGYSSSLTTGLVQVHSYIRLGKQAFAQSVKSVPLADLPNGKDDKTSYKKYVSKMLEVATRLRVRDETEIPSEPGICIEAGFVSVPDGRFHEKTSIGFNFPEYPDIRFSIRTIKTDSPSQKDSLEYSLKAGQENIIAAGLAQWFSGLKILRQGPRQVGDWVGSEAFLRMPPEERGQPSTHEFRFKSIGKARDILRPYVDMELSSGVDGNTKGVNEPSLTNDEMAALWDKLTGSIRARPTNEGAATPQPAPEKPTPPRPQSKVPLGTQIASANRCPQSGTWTCDQAEALGGNRRFFNEGETLPSVLLPISRNLWQSLRGDAENQSQATTWTLVARPEDTE